MSGEQRALSSKGKKSLAPLSPRQCQKLGEMKAEPAQTDHLKSLDCRSEAPGEKEETLLITMSVLISLLKLFACTPFLLFSQTGKIVLLEPQITTGLAPGLS